MTLLSDLPLLIMYRTCSEATRSPPIVQRTCDRGDQRCLGGLPQPRTCPAPGPLADAGQAAEHVDLAAQAAHLRRCRDAVAVGGGALITT